MVSHTDTFNGVENTYMDGVLVGSSSPPRYKRVVAATNVRTGDYVNPTPHSYKITKIWYPQGWYEYPGGGKIRYRKEGTLGGFGYYTDDSEAPSLSTVYNEALSRLYSQVRDSDLALSTDIAEWKQLDHMLEKSFERIAPRLYRFARNAKKKRKSWMTVDQARTAIGNAWLQAQYGWRPLLSSIWELLQFERSISSSRKLKARAQRVNTWTHRVAGTASWPPYHWMVRYSTRCEIGITYRVSSPALFDLTRVTSLNPIAIAWELMPYSFVVDWFVDVGGYMRDWEQSWFLGLDFVRGYVTYTTKEVLVGSYSGSWDQSSIEAPFKTITVQLNRSGLTAPPRPKPPSFEPHLGWQRLTSAAALINQILSPHPDRITRTRFINGVLYPK